MKAARFVRLQAAPDVQEVDKPTVQDPQDVIVRIAGAGVCRTDIHILDGAAPLQPPPPPPFTLGHENTGWIDAVGSGVRSVSVGDPVILHPAVTCGVCVACRNGEDMYCTKTRFPGVDGTDGGYAEFLRTSVRAVVPLAKGVPPAAQAPLADAGLTAYHAVRRVLPELGAGSIVAVLGVGGLGHIGVQLVRTMSPARVFALDVAPERLEFATRLGAERGFSPADPGFPANFLAASGGNGADVVLDFVGEQNSPQVALEILRRGGTYSIVGYGGTLSVPTVAMITREIRILGNFVGNYRDLVELMELQRQGRVAVSAKEYALTDAPRAVEDLRRGRVLGRAVLIP
jgi:D-arabinose 1-dehydrogenase-like Zn-dependent alcohol dehydrogenase